jgi:hypothetical protein
MFSTSMHPSLPIRCVSSFIIIIISAPVSVSVNALPQFVAPHHLWRHLKIKMFRAALPHFLIPAKFIWTMMMMLMYCRFEYKCK